MSAVSTILRYDFRRFFRDRLMFAFSVLVLVMYVLIVQIVPDDAQPDWGFATTRESADLVHKALAGMDENGEFKLKVFDTEEELKNAFDPDYEPPEEDGKGDKPADVDDGAAEEEFNLFAGFVIPADIKAMAMRGEKPEIRIYVDESMPDEAQQMAEVVAEMIALGVFGAAPTFQEENKDEVFIGPQITERTLNEKMRLSMAMIILMMEMLALASLVSRELKSGTVHALLTTTVSLPSYFLAKVLFGVIIAFTQAFLVTLLTGSLNDAPVVLGLHIFFGAFMFTGFGLMVGSKGRDLMEVITWGMLVYIPALIPSITAMLPGSPPLWVMAMPTYPMVHGMLSAADPEPAVAPWVYLLWTVGWTLAAMAGGLVLMRRRLK